MPRHDGTFALTKIQTKKYCKSGTALERSAEKLLEDFNYFYSIETIPLSPEAEKIFLKQKKNI